MGKEEARLLTWRFSCVTCFVGVVILQPSLRAVGYHCGCRMPHVPGWRLPSCWNCQRGMVRS